METEEMLKEEQAKEHAERQTAIKNVLNKTKLFKEFITGREEQWEAVKEAIAIHAFKLPIAGDDTISKDFMAGMRYFSELVDGYATQFDKAYEALGKE